MSEVVYRGRVTIERQKPPIRRATMHCSGEQVLFGVPDEVGAHYGFEPGSVDLHAGTIDYIIAAAGG